MKLLVRAVYFVNDISVESEIGYYDSKDMTFNNLCLKDYNVTLENSATIIVNEININQTDSHKQHWELHIIPNDFTLKLFGITQDIEAEAEEDEDEDEVDDIVESDTEQSDNDYDF